MSWLPNGPALLFCPSDRPDRFNKALRSADTVILDLEDGVLEADREQARESLVKTIIDPKRTVVRVNPVTTKDHALDLEALRATPYRVVMLAKTESADQMNSIKEWKVIALCETATGIRESDNIAAAKSTAGLMWGAEDLSVSLGATSSRHADGTYRDFARYARSRVLISAKSHGRAVIDAVYLNIRDLEGLGREVTDGAASGFDATACIHPDQVSTVRLSYRPSDVDISWAMELLDMARKEKGVFAYQGKMVDAPLLYQARRVLARAGLSEH